jgi:hypothetical protein
MSSSDDLLDNSKTSYAEELVEEEEIPGVMRTLWFGIISIPAAFLWSVPGIILSILCFHTHGKDEDVFLSYQAKYRKSYQKSLIGFVCGLFGVVFSAIMGMIYLASSVAPDFD